MHVPRLSVLHGGQCHLNFDSIHKLLGMLGLGMDAWELGVGQGTAGKLRWESRTCIEKLKNVEQVFVSVSVDKKAGIPVLPFLTALNNNTAN
jgi:hypothetical protein